MLFSHDSDLVLDEVRRHPGMSDDLPGQLTSLGVMVPSERATVMGRWGRELHVLHAKLLAVQACLYAHTAEYGGGPVSEDLADQITLLSNKVAPRITQLTAMPDLVKTWNAQIAEAAPGQTVDSIAPVVAQVFHGGPRE